MSVISWTTSMWTTATRQATARELLCKAAEDSRGINEQPVDRLKSSDVEKMRLCARFACASASEGRSQLGIANSKTTKISQAATRMKYRAAIRSSRRRRGGE